MKCRNCGRLVTDDMKYCPGCAWPMNPNVQALPSSSKPLTMRLVYIRHWMLGCLWGGVWSLVGGVVLAVVAGESVGGVILAICGFLLLVIGALLLKKYGTGWNE